MPNWKRNIKAKQRVVKPNPKTDWECPFCARAFSRYSGGPATHLRSCKQQSTQSSLISAVCEEPDDRSSDGPDLVEPSNQSNESESSNSDNGVQVPHSPGALLFPIPEPLPFPSDTRLPSPCDESEDVALLVDLPTSLEEGKVWIKRHPASGIPSGYTCVDPQVPASIDPCRAGQIKTSPPLWYPFRTHADFLQAEIFSRYNCSNSQIDAQLNMFHQSAAYKDQPLSESVTLSDAADYHSTLARASGASEEFRTQPVITTFKGQEYSHDVNFRPILPLLRDYVRDPELFKQFALHPTQPFVCRSDNDARPMRFWEELEHGQDWWNMQDSVPSDHHILYLVAYMDETNVSTFGSVEVWPVYVWVGNIPGSTRKQRKRKGGPVLVGYLPEASKGDVSMSDADLAELRACVFHDALRCMFESLEVPARHGDPMRCGDGRVRIFHPTIGGISADYKELTRITCILGSKSQCPCPICLVPRTEQHNLDGTWTLRTVEATRKLVLEAHQAKTKRDRDKTLHQESLRGIQNIFHRVIPSYFSVYKAVVADPLHQIEQGIFGKHLWPWIKSQLSEKQATVLDKRFKSIQRYPDLKHFPNGVTTLKNVTGSEHGVILRMLAPLIEDLLPVLRRKSVMTVLRSLAEIHMLAKFTTHTEATLEILEAEISRFGSVYAKVAQEDDSLSCDYPKLHSLSHLVDIIRRKSTTDNYHTGLGEALHPQSKIDYRHTNHQANYKEQMLRTYQERELLVRIRARIDQQNSLKDLGPRANNLQDSTNRIDFERRPIKKFTQTFMRELKMSDPGAKFFARELRTFVYQDIGGFGDTFHFRERALPNLDDTTLLVHRLVRIGYISLLDSRDGLDVARVTESWRGQGARKDFVIYNDKHGLAVARLLAVFTLRLLKRSYPIAYIHPFRVLSRNRTSGYLELKDDRTRNFVFVDTIIRSCIVLSPNVRQDTHVLYDLEGADMYLRLRD